MNEKVILTDIQMRVLGSLIEKSATTPDQYPLTLNSTKLACNQKSNREPVVNYDENEIRRALYELESLGFVKQLSLSDSRVAKYEHYTTKALDITVKEQAILSVLMLRGPQTLGEIRTRTQRYYDFENLQEVERVIGRMINKEPFPLAVHLPRVPGQKESRYAHLLDGKEVDEIISSVPVSISPKTSSNEVVELKEEIELLKLEIEDLKSRVEKLETN